MADVHKGQIWLCPDMHQHACKVGGESVRNTGSRIVRCIVEDCVYVSWWKQARFEHPAAMLMADPQPHEPPPPPPPPPPLQHDFTDKRGLITFCSRCSCCGAEGEPEACEPAPHAERMLAIENWIGVQMDMQELPAFIARWWQMDPDRWTWIGIGKRAPYHSQHTQHLHTLAGGWNRRAP